MLSDHIISPTLFQSNNYVSHTNWYVPYCNYKVEKC